MNSKRGDRFLSILEPRYLSISRATCVMRRGAPPCH